MQNRYVEGEVFIEAQGEMALIKEQMLLHQGKSFDNAEDAFAFSEDMHCNLRAYSPMNKSYYYINHSGELLNRQSWVLLYRNILSYTYEHGDVIKKAIAVPDRFEDMNNAKCIGEQSDGLHKPLYHRDYFTPRGYFDEIRGTFNVAKPFKYFAKNTGADVSYIHTFLKHIAGDNYIYLLAWLREKMVNPTKKTEVVPVFISKEQGTGKTTFGEVICKGLFEEENVLVTDQYDSSARFNADYADALIVCMEEKKQDDRRNDASAIKSRVTATTIRKEQKGVDPIYQESYTDFIITSNSEVPIKFDSVTQRRFMVIEVDEKFTRSNPLADEVFTKLYGYDGNGDKKCNGFRDNPKAIQQFKYDLLYSEEVAKTNPRDFVKTEAYERCFTMPRTNDAVEIEAMLKALAPFIKASLERCTKVCDVEIVGENDEKFIIGLDSIGSVEALMFLNAYAGQPPRVAINRMLMFIDQFSGKPYPHSVVERAIINMRTWFRREHGVIIRGDAAPPAGGFKGVDSRYRMSPTMWCILDKDTNPVTFPDSVTVEHINNGEQVRIGTRVRYSDKTYLPDENGVLETLNELKPGHSTRSKDDVAYLDTFLLECDTTTAINEQYEHKILTSGIKEIQAEQLYAARLVAQKAEADRLFKEQKVCRVVYSGAKSLHLLVRVDPAPQNLDERKWLFAYLCKTMSDTLNFDMSVGDPSRLTRAPITATRVTNKEGVRIVGTQRLMYEDWTNVYKLHWRPIYEAWLNKPKDAYEQARGKSMVPTKEIYRDAARALMEGTFFKDKVWNGQRQETFFPAYRIVRLLGYTKDQIFEEMKEQLTDYYRQDQVEYWMSRYDCKLIDDIEEDLND